MDELNKQNVEEESAAAQPGGESAQPVPPADTGAQQAQQPEGEGTTVPETQLGKLICPRCGNAFEPKEKKCPPLRHEEQFEAVQDLRRDDHEKRKALPEVRCEE